MAILWINLFSVYAVSLFSRAIAKPSPIGPVYIKPNKLMAFVVIVIFVMISGLRNNIGDTFYYMHSYVVDPYTWDYVISKKDIGFGIFQMILKMYTSNPQALVFITALITNALIVMVMYKYSRLFELSIYIYITSGLYVVSMNGIRQFLAGAIIFAATKYLFNGSWLKYMLVILFASTIHQSALILIPIYFIVRRKAWTTTTFTMLAVAILLVLGYNQLSDAIFSAIEETQYGNYKDFNEGGANFLRVAVQGVPILLAYMGREKLRQIFPESDYVVNMSLLGLVFMIIATQNWIFARFIIYFGLYNVILMSWIVKVFTKESQRIIYYAIILCYFIYFYYENVVVLNLLYRSDYISF
ncbi:EpsG family protein [Paenibacillus sp. OAS669]|uniref:EpsG family protein n=1 Tax=Paenibacillus sp. OAS669 TaxID=2663821 RepID=UPI00178BFE43|nr:EpsG family protein [Paenibacillus sp. OAS669]MBE1444705.1 transmembrane protein EpsG [Paenibacillus sp. OAS669]